MNDIIINNCELFLGREADVRVICGLDRRSKLYTAEALRYTGFDRITVASGTGETAEKAVHELLDATSQIVFDFKESEALRHSLRQKRYEVDSYRAAHGLTTERSVAPPRASELLFEPSDLRGVASLSRNSGYPTHNADRKSCCNDQHVAENVDCEDSTCWDGLCHDSAGDRDSSSVRDMRISQPTTMPRIHCSPAPSVKDSIRNEPRRLVPSPATLPLHLRRPKEDHSVLPPETRKSRIMVLNITWAGRGGSVRTVLEGQMTATFLKRVACEYALTCSDDFDGTARPVALGPHSISYISPDGDTKLCATLLGAVQGNRPVDVPHWAEDLSERLSAEVVPEFNVEVRLVQSAKSL